MKKQNEGKKILIPEGVEEIPPRAFSSCRSLEKIIIPKSVKKIRESAFFNCVSLKEIVIPEGVEEIGKYAFQDCLNLEMVTFPSSLKKIGLGAFKDCDNLKETVISEISNIISKTSSDDFEQRFSFITSRPDIIGLELFNYKTKMFQNVYLKSFISCETSGFIPFDIALDNKIYGISIDPDFKILSQNTESFGNVHIEIIRTTTGCDILQVDNEGDTDQIVYYVIMSQRPS